VQESVAARIGQRWVAASRCCIFLTDFSLQPQSHQPSDVLPVFPIAGELSAFGGGRSLSPAPDDAYEGLSMGADEQSLQVMYEDPGQREERLRLASLIGESVEEGADSRKRPRRSTRRGGF
jgi:hypothetical protein